MSKVYEHAKNILRLELSRFSANDRQCNITQEESHSG